MTTVQQPSTGVQLRRVREEDILQIYRLERRCFSQPWPFEAFYRHLESRAFLVATDGNDIVGYVVGAIIDGVPGPIGHIKDLAVHPSYRRRGLGRRLLAVALRELADAGASRARLEVRASNTPAIALYRSFGFEVEHVRSEYYGDDEDALVMTRPLASGSESVLV